MNLNVDITYAIILKHITQTCRDTHDHYLCSSTHVSTCTHSSTHIHLQIHMCTPTHTLKSPEWCGSMNIDTIDVNAANCRGQVSPIIFAVMSSCYCKLEKLIDWPWNGCGRHLVYHSCLQTSEITLYATKLVNRPESCSHAIDVWQMSPCTCFLSVQKSLANVQRHCNCCSHSPCHSSRAHVGKWVVMPIFV